MSLPTLLFNVASFLLILVAILTNLQIALSYIGIPLPVLREISQILAVWIGFFAFSLITSSDENISVPYFYQRFPNDVRPYIDQFNALVKYLVILSIMTSSTLLTIAFGSGTTPLGNIPLFFIYFPPVIGAGVALLYLEDTYLTSFF